MLNTTSQHTSFTTVWLINHCRDLSSRQPQSLTHRLTDQLIHATIFFCFIKLIINNSPPTTHKSKCDFISHDEGGHNYWTNKINLKIWICYFTSGRELKNGSLVHLLAGCASLSIWCWSAFVSILICSFHSLCPHSIAQTQPLYPLTEPHRGSSFRHLCCTKSRCKRA